MTRRVLAARRAEGNEGLGVIVCRLPSSLSDISRLNITQRQLSTADSRQLITQRYVLRPRPTRMHVLRTDDSTGRVAAKSRDVPRPPHRPPQGARDLRHNFVGLAMLGQGDIQTKPLSMRVSIRAPKDIHSAKHPPRPTRVTLMPEVEPPATVAASLDALDAEAQTEGETEE